MTEVPRGASGRLSDVLRPTQRCQEQAKVQPPAKQLIDTKTTSPEPSSSTTAGDQSAVDKIQQSQEQKIRRRPPSSPYDIIGFIVEDQYKARYVVDTKAERLWNCIIRELKAMGEGIGTEKDLLALQRFDPFESIVTNDIRQVFVYSWEDV